MSGRRKHNEEHLRTFLNKSYPNCFQGSPDPELVFDKTKPGSTTLLKKGALDRADARFARNNTKRPEHMRIKTEKGEEPDPATEESFSRCLKLLTAGASSISDLHRLAANLVLLNPNNAGGWVEMERLEASGDRAAKDVGAMCRTVVEMALDALERDGYWLDVGTDETYRSRREEWEANRAKERKSDAENAYRIIYRAWKRWQSENQRIVEIEGKKRREPSMMAAKEMFRKAYSDEHRYELSPWKLDKAIRFSEGRDTSERPEPGVWRDLGGDDEAA